MLIGKKISNRITKNLILSKFKTIKLKFAIPVIILTSFVLILFGMINYIDSYIFEKHDLQKKANIMLNLANMTMADPLWNFNDEGIKQASKAILADKEVYLLEVSDYQNNVIFSETKNYLSINPKGLIVLESKISKAGFEIGSVKIGITDYYRKNRLAHIIFYRLSTLFILISLLWLIIFIISDIVTKPISDLKEGIAEIAKGDFSNRVNIESQDEIADLANKFNFMADNVETLLNKTRQTVEKERLIWNIIAESISSLDVNQIKKHVVNEVGKYFNADRCYFVEFDLGKMTGKPVEKENEYLSSPNIPSIIGYSFPRNEVGKFVDYYTSTKDLGIFDYEKIRKENKEENRGMLKYCNNFNLSIGIPFFYADTFEAVIVIEYLEKQVSFSDDDLKFFKIIGYQTGLAFHQVKLYQETKQTAQREALLREITEKIRNSLDINETLEFICSEVATIFNVQRATITAPINREHPENIEIKSEYTLNESIISLSHNNKINDEATNALHHYWFNKVVKNGKIYQIDNMIEFQESDLIKNIYESMGVKSIIGTPITSGDDKWGGLYLSEYNYYRHWTDEEKQLLKTISAQIYIAIKQAELYSTAKRQAERETTLRTIISTIRSTLDINQTKKTVIDEIVKIYNPDRAFIIEFDSTKKYIPISKISEHLSSNNIPSYIGVDFSLIPGFEYIQKQHTKNKDIYFSDLDKYLEKNNLVGSDTEKFFRDFKQISSIVVNITYENELIGNLGIIYESKKELKEEDLEFLRAIANQVGIAFHQSKLYNSMQQTTKREISLRKITESIRSSLDIDTIKNTIVTETGSTFNADRCFIRIYEKGNIFLPIAAEYLSSSDVKSVKDFEFTDEFNNFVKSCFFKNQPIIIQDFQKSLHDPNLSDEFKEFIKSLDIKSSCGVPIYNNSELIGAFVIQYTKQTVNLTDELIDIFRNIANQAGIALNQAYLYETVQHNAEKEKLLREILSQIKLSQSVDQVYNYILAKLSDIFNVNKTLVVEVSELEPKKPVVKYKFNKLGQSFLQDEPLPQICIDDLSKLMKISNTIVINDVKNYQPENNELQNFFSKNNIKSLLAYPLIKEGKEKILFGIFILCSDDIYEWTQAKITLLEEILNISITVIWEIMKRNELDELRNTFILTLAHDLEVPLVGERRALEFIMSIPPGQLLDKYKNIIEETIKNNQDISNFLKKLVDSYNYELGRKKLYYSETSISEFINEIIDSQKDFAKSKSISINLDFQENLPYIDIDKDEIKKVVNTLLENALTYSQINSLIEVKSYLINNNAVVCIVDNGPGIPVEVQKRLFKRYEMAIAIERKIGAGLGLYLAKQIIETHGGSIWFKSEENKGTTFCFSLPILKPTN